MTGLKKDLNYPRRMVIYAVFDILDQMGSQYEQTMMGDIKAEVKVLGNIKMCIRDRASGDPRIPGSPAPT